jgi:hypothetical protein
MPGYNPHELPERWLMGACTSGDPMRWAVVAVHDKVTALTAENERLRAELTIAERSMPKVTAVEPPPEVQAQIEAWYTGLDAD